MNQGHSLLRNQENASLLGISERVYLQIGELGLSVLAGVTSWEESGSNNIAIYERVEGKPVSVHRSEGLDNLSMRISLNALLMRDKSINSQLDIIQEMKASKYPLRILFENMEYKGQWLIVEVRKSYLQMLDDGTITDAEVSLDLTEYVASNVIEINRIEKVKTIKQKKQVASKRQISNSSRFESSHIKDALPGYKQSSLPSDFYGVADIY